MTSIQRTRIKEPHLRALDPVRLLLHCVHQMDLTPLYRSFRRAERNLVSPHQLLAILIYAYMNRIYSSRPCGEAKSAGDDEEHDRDVYDRIADEIHQGIAEEIEACIAEG